MAEVPPSQAACAAEVARHRAAFGDVAHMTADELLRLLRSGRPATVVDVRSPEERARWWLRPFIQVESWDDQERLIRSHQEYLRLDGKGDLCRPDLEAYIEERTRLVQPVAPGDTRSEAELRAAGNLVAQPFRAAATAIARAERTAERAAAKAAATPAEAGGGAAPKPRERPAPVPAGAPKAKGRGRRGAASQPLR